MWNNIFSIILALLYLFVSPASYLLENDRNISLSFKNEFSDEGKSSMESESDGESSSAEEKEIDDFECFISLIDVFNKKNKSISVSGKSNYPKDCLAIGFYQNETPPPDLIVIE